jgi:hypothetical protein
MKLSVRLVTLATVLATAACAPQTSSNSSSGKDEKTGNEGRRTPGRQHGVRRLERGQGHRPHREDLGHRGRQDLRLAVPRRRPRPRLPVGISSTALSSRAVS